MVLGGAQARGWHRPEEPRESPRPAHTKAQGGVHTQKTTVGRTRARLAPASASSLKNCGKSAIAELDRRIVLLQLNKQDSPDRAKGTEAEAHHAGPFLQAIKLVLCDGDTGCICDSNTADHSGDPADGGTEGHSNGGGRTLEGALTALLTTYDQPISRRPACSKWSDNTQLPILTAVTVTPRSLQGSSAQSSLWASPGSDASLHPAGLLLCHIQDLPGDWNSQSPVGPSVSRDHVTTEPGDTQSPSSR